MLHKRAILLFFILAICFTTCSIKRTLVLISVKELGKVMITLTLLWKVNQNDWSSVEVHRCIYYQNNNTPIVHFDGFFVFICYFKTTFQRIVVSFCWLQKCLKDFSVYAHSPIYDHKRILPTDIFAWQYKKVCCEITWLKHLKRPLNPLTQEGN